MARAFADTSGPGPCRVDFGVIQGATMVHRAMVQVQPERLGKRGVVLGVTALRESRYFQAEPVRRQGSQDSSDSSSFSARSRANSTGSAVDEEESRATDKSDLEANVELDDCGFRYPWDPPSFPPAFTFAIVFRGSAEAVGVHSAVFTVRVLMDGAVTPVRVPLYVTVTVAPEAGLRQLQLMASSEPFVPLWLRVMFDQAPTAVVTPERVPHFPFVEKMAATLPDTSVYWSPIDTGLKNLVELHERAIRGGAAAALSFEARLDRQVPPLSGEIKRWNTVISAHPEQFLEARRRLVSHVLLARMSVLVQLELEALRVSVKAFDLFNVRLVPDKKRDFVYHVVVPTLREMHPRVRNGDRLQLRRYTAPTQEYVAIVVEAMGDRLTLVAPFSRNLLTQAARSPASTAKGAAASAAAGSEPTDLFCIRFCVRKLTFDRILGAMERASPAALASVVLPVQEDLLPRTARTLLQAADPVVPNGRTELNPEQQAAVVNIVNRQSGGAAHIVFGPPGTGKTLVAAEAILHVLEAHRAVGLRPRILACAASEAAVDHLLAVLHACLAGSQEDRENESSSAIGVRYSPRAGPVRIYRLNEPSRGIEQLLDMKLLKYSTMKDGVFTVPTVEQVADCDIVLSTLSGTSLLASDDTVVPRGTFSHLFVDEAAQATESETLLPLLHFAEMRGPVMVPHVVLLGDHRQLGPQVPPCVLAAGGGVALQERLLRGPSLGWHGEKTPAGPVPVHADPRNRCTSMLTRNYRSHLDLVSVPSLMFYENLLRPAADQPATRKRTAAALSLLGRRGSFPLLIEGVVGAEERDRDESTSWYNGMECIKIVQMVKSIVSTKGSSFTSNSIGVIAPFQLHVVRLRKMLRAAGYSGIRVGLTEDYQGQEEEIIIVSTVRSSPRYVPYDAANSVGLLFQPRRFNVAVTRAKALLIVVGNPHMLVHDPHWRSMLQYASRNDGYQGADFAIGTSGTSVPPELQPLANRPDCRVVDAVASKILHLQVESETE
jgi:hypothetical protein